MKRMKNIIAKAALVLPLTAALSAQAGDMSKNVIEPINYLVEDAGLTLDAGYETAYYFRGLWFSNNNVYTGLNWSTDLSDKVSINLGGLYTTSLGTDVPQHFGGGQLEYSEIDLFGGITYDAGFAAFTLAYTQYFFMDTFSGSVNGQTFGVASDPDSTITGASDISLTASVPVGNGAIYGTYVYDFKIDANYFETGASYTFAVTPWMSLVPSVAIGYGMDYYTYVNLTGVSDGFTATRVMLTAPIQLTPSAAFVPYVGANFSMDAREQINTVEGPNDLYGGAKFSVSF
jgi:hypothetical protein